MPGACISIASDVSPLYREYERTNTTAMNAYLMPAMGSYIRRLQQELAHRGYQRDLYIMQSNGGIATVAEAERFPVRHLPVYPHPSVHLAQRRCLCAGFHSLGGEPAFHGIHPGTIEHAAGRGCFHDTKGA